MSIVSLVEKSSPERIDGSTISEVALREQLRKQAEKLSLYQLRELIHKLTWDAHYRQMQNEMYDNVRLAGLRSRNSVITTDSTEKPTSANTCESGGRNEDGPGSR